MVEKMLGKRPPLDARGEELVTGIAGRDFLLDGGGVSALAVDRDLLAAYLQMLRLRFDGALLVPVPVLTEVRSGHRRSGVLVDRLIKAIGAEGDIYAPLVVAAAIRAGVLRGEASRGSRRDISTPDAQVVAIAEELSYKRAHHWRPARHQLVCWPDPPCEHRGGYRQLTGHGSDGPCWFGRYRRASVADNRIDPPQRRL